MCKCDCCDVGVAAAVLVLVQTIPHMAFFVWIDAVYECRTTIDNLTFSRSMYYMYLNKGCNSSDGGDDVQANRIAIGFVTLMMDQLSDFEPVVDALDTIGKIAVNKTVSSRTDAYAMAYIFLDATWMITAVGLLLGTALHVKEPLPLFFFYGPWMLITLAELVVDVVATAQFAVDALTLRNLHDYLHFVGVTNVRTYHTALKDTPHMTRFSIVVPTLIFLFVFARLGVLWLANLVLWFLVGLALVGKCYGNEDQEPTATLHSWWRGEALPQA